MKKYLLLICVLAVSYPVFSQSAYTQFKIQSREDYEYEKSQRYVQRDTYSTYTGRKQWVSCEFRYSNGEKSYGLYSNGRIYDFSDGLYGHYFVGEEMYYKCYKVYIRWDHGGETTGSLNYKERSDGKPVFRIKIGGSTKWYNPL